MGERELKTHHLSRLADPGMFFILYFIFTTVTNILRISTTPMNRDDTSAGGMEVNEGWARDATHIPWILQHIFRSKTVKRVDSH